MVRHLHEPDTHLALHHRHLVQKQPDWTTWVNDWKLIVHITCCRVKVTCNSPEHAVDMRKM